MKVRDFNKLLHEMKDNVNAVEKIYIEYYPKIVLTVKAYYGNCISAEDVGHEVFLSLIATAKKALPDEEPFPYIDCPMKWMHTLAERKAIDAWRAHRQELPLIGDYPTEFAIENLELNIDVKNALSQLKPKTAELLYLYYFVGWRQKELASRFGLNAGNVRLMVSRGRRQLKSILGEKYL